MAAGTTSNSRHLDRIPTNALVTLLFESEGQQRRQRARLCDISEKGMRLKTSGPLVKGQEVEIVSQHGMQEPERARVVWISEDPSDSTYYVGVEILNPHLPDPAATGELLSEHKAQTASTRQPKDDARRVVGDDRGPMGNH
jgi:PilZ domain